MNADAHWHIDKRIPIALIIVLVGQFTGAIWWASGATIRLENVERTAASFAPLPERLTRVEEKLGAVQEGITEIKRLVQDRRR
jgi:hypothetical protein